MEFSIKDFFSKCDQILFCAVIYQFFSYKDVNIRKEMKLPVVKPTRIENNDLAILWWKGMTKNLVLKAIIESMN